MHEIFCTVSVFRFKQCRQRSPAKSQYICDFTGWCSCLSVCPSVCLSIFLCLALFQSLSSKKSFSFFCQEDTQFLPIWCILMAPSLGYTDFRGIPMVTPTLMTSCVQWCVVPTWCIVKSGEALRDRYSATQQACNKGWCANSSQSDDAYFRMVVRRNGYLTSYLNRWRSIQATLNRRGWPRVPWHRVVCMRLPLFVETLFQFPAINPAILMPNNMYLGPGSRDGTHGTASAKYSRVLGRDNWWCICRLFSLGI